MQSNFVILLFFHALFHITSVSSQQQQLLLVDTLRLHYTNYEHPLEYN